MVAKSFEICWKWNSKTCYSDRLLFVVFIHLLQSNQNSHGIDSAIDRCIGCNQNPAVALIMYGSTIFTDNGYQSKHYVVGIVPNIVGRAVNSSSSSIPCETSHH